MDCRSGEDSDESQGAHETPSATIGYTTLGPLLCRLRLLPHDPQSRSDDKDRFMAVTEHPQMGWICAEFVAVLN